MVSAVEFSHPVGLGCLAGAGRCEDLWVADAQLEVEETCWGGDATVFGVGLLHRVAVLQSVDAHPSLIWRNKEDIIREEVEV